MVGTFLWELGTLESIRTLSVPCTFGDSEFPLLFHL